MTLARRGVLGLATAAGLSACAGLPRLPAVPETLAQRADFPGIPGARFYVDEEDAELLRWLQEQQRRAAIARAAGRPDNPADVLVLSGGGEDGAFGAGLLTEWTGQGTRPEFRVVTGISTGALTAPFAFLGPSRDAHLREVYTTIDISRVLAWRQWTAAVFDDALGDSTPLAATIARFVDAGMLAEIAAAYDAGRLLLIGTTDLDARRGVIWNIGAIARSGSPQALELVRKVLLASASIPGAFPPVMFDVEADGRRFQEMHVDGGAVAQLFLFPMRVAAAARAREPKRAPTRVWVIRNGKLRPQRQTTPRRTIAVLAATVSTLTQASGSYDVTRIWLRARGAGLAFHLAYVGEDFAVPYETAFDPAYMRALFDYGQARMRAGTAWTSTPPAEA
ncbi:patatin-like phospholipase family protein [Roseicella aquatilis]|uniref:patatin-like phospholipase family protein n=1 Tax=Roseicella aquatilis TaxID=2527868 RepID=UPI001404C434|nr:patatin-like phospholipase family protein [Roseicella aquatilis]